MSVRICGHEVRWQKPIKIYNFFKNGAALLVLSLIFAMPAQADDPDARSMAAIETSSGALGPCGDALQQRAATESPPHLRRNAGTVSAPAMALALALGYRNVAGPMEKSASPRGSGGINDVK